MSIQDVCKKQEAKLFFLESTLILFNFRAVLTKEAWSLFSHRYSHMQSDACCEKENTKLAI